MVVAGRGRVMRGLSVALMVIGLLTFAGRAAGGPPPGDNGIANPLGLISAAAIQPFWGLGANVTMFEITSPTGNNASLHGVFFDAACTRDQSVFLPASVNDVLVVTTDTFGADYNGLLVIFNIQNPIHVRGHWVNLAEDFIRLVDPIAVAAAESTTPVAPAGPGQTWNPMRSGASWVAPLEDATTHTEIYLVCPSSAITSALPAPTFPPAPSFAFATTPSSGKIFGVIYDSDETPLRNVKLPCECLSTIPVLSINSVYGDPAVFSSGQQPFFYTKLFTYGFSGPGSIPADPNTFTGYRSILVSGTVWPGGTGNEFGPLNNGSAAAYQAGSFSSVPPGLR